MGAAVTSLATQIAAAQPAEGEQDEAELSVTVIGSRPQPETASTVQLSPRDLTAAPRTDAAELLRQVPGLTLVQHGSEGKGQQIFLRGFDAVHGADLEITVDGLPLNEWSNVHAQGYLDLGVLIPEMIRGITVTKGPFTLEQGAFAMAGSADYRLGVPPGDLGFRAAYTVGSTNRHRIFGGWSPEDGAGEQLVGVEVTHDDGFGDNRGLDRATFNGRVRLFDLGAAGTLHLLGLGGVSSFELPGILRDDDVEAGRVAFRGAYDPETGGTSARALAALIWDWRHGDHALTVTATGGYRSLALLENFTGFLMDAQHGDRRAQRQETRSFGLNGAHEARLRDELGVRTGFGVRGDDFSQREDAVGADQERLAARRDLDGSQLLAHGMAGVRWSPVDPVRIDAGGRVDVVHVAVTDALAGGERGGGTRVVASPRVTARYGPGDDWALFLAGGRGFRPPEARAFSRFDPGRTGIGADVDAGGAPALTVSTAVEGGARWRPVDRLGVTVAGFATFIERESIFDHVSGVSLELGGTRRVGGELQVTSDPLPWLQVSADLTVVDARFVGSGNRVPLAPWLVSGVRAVVTQERGVRGGLRVLTVAPRTLPHGATGATLVRADATLGYHWRRTRLDLELDNVLHRPLREGEYHYASHWRHGAPASELPALHTAAGPPLVARLTLGALF